ncbi:MAG TPA: MFS transporter, partial [Pirellulaceae bacterium]|nr:MFS transporter [Pirellulaceae bacterium]
AALLGWMFDGAEMGLFSMVGRPAIKDLLQTTDEAVVGLWFSVITASFLVGAATGGVLFGWLGDRIGRVRAMALSVLTYALFTGLCGIAGTPIQVGVLRFIASLGMGGEWSLGVALVMEVWPNRSRAFMAGLIGAAANVGYLLVGLVGFVLLDVIGALQDGMLAIGLRESWVEMLVRNNGWRLMMIMGTLPAILTFFIRMFVPESAKWQKEHAAGSTGHWATQDLIAVVIGLVGPAMIVTIWAWPVKSPSLTWTLIQAAVTLVGLAIAVVGYTYPVVRYFQRLHLAGSGEDWQPTLRRMLLGACLSGVALLGTWGSTQWAPSWADSLTEKKHQAQQKALIDDGKEEEAQALVRPRAKEFTQISLAIGAIVGTILAAMMGDWIGRRAAYCLLCALSLGSVYALFLGNSEYGPMMLFWTFIAGTLTASFYGWLPLYLPELFRTKVRATGQGFGFNFGRILAAIGVLQTGNLMGLFKDGVTIGGIDIPGGYPLACSTMSLVYLIGIGIIWLAPETRGQPLPD